MMEERNITALRMERQFLSRQADPEEYNHLYRDLQPGQNVYWQGFGDPPGITFRAAFDDIAYNRERQQDRILIKGRFQNGNVGWIYRDEVELFAGLYRKPLDSFTQNQKLLLNLIRREGPMNIQLMKEMTGLLVKEITPALHRLQEAFLVYEDQYDGEWDRAWYLFDEMFPEDNVAKYTRQEALRMILPRFAYRHVAFDVKMAKSFYKLPEKEIQAAVGDLVKTGEIVEHNGMFLLPSDARWLENHNRETPPSVFVLHRNDFLVKSNEHSLKKQFQAAGHDILQYILIDGEFHGAVIGKFKNGPYILQDVLVNLPKEEKECRMNEIIEAVYLVNGRKHPLERYDGKELEESK